MRAHLRTRATRKYIHTHTDTYAHTDCLHPGLSHAATRGAALTKGEKGRHREKDTRIRDTQRHAYKDTLIRNAVQRNTRK